MAAGAFDAAQVSRWRPTDFAGAAQLPVIGAADAVPIFPDLDLWDSWPLQHEDGRTVRHDGRQYWFFLSAPRLPDPAQRHDVARIRLASKGADGWRDHGDTLPDDLNPGTRQWAGSAVLLDDGETVLLLFTAAGRKGAPHSFEQRLCAVRGVLGNDGPGNWSAPEELVAADGWRYVLDRQESGGTPGFIKGFRDPAWLRDPATGKAHLLFTASAGWDDHAFNGIVGMATMEDGHWVLDDPLVEAVGVNNELERAHIVVQGGRYYLFWSTQRRTFDPAGMAGPNGLYAMVAESLAGPWCPVNGHGLVAGNPESEPTQGYSWWVTGEGEVWSFVDHWGLAGRSLDAQPELVRQQFGGTPAPVFRLRFDGDRIAIA
ncbi:MAG: glycoside hydrolase family 68 protein [Sphingomonadales bacterium]|nr:glycoside hydrolase family 68 protein [Sphingomonadales bacterium]